MNKEIKDFVKENAEKILEDAGNEVTDLAISYFQDYIGVSEAAAAEHRKNGFDVPPGQPMLDKKFHAMVISIICGEAVDTVVANYSMAVTVAYNKMTEAVATYRNSLAERIV